MYNTAETSLRNIQYIYLKLQSVTFLGQKLSEINIWENT